jgi:hypothetical protein
MGDTESKLEMWTEEDPQMRQDLEDHIFETLKTRYEKRFGTGPVHKVLKSIEDDIYVDAKLEMVEIRLQSMLDIWTKQYDNRLNELQRLANDSQNVHTGMINNQIKEAGALLDKVVVPLGQKTIDEIYDAWSQTMSWATIESTYMDMLAYGKRSHIYVADDYLYRKMLRQLWALIKTYKGDVYKTLVARLYEECSESVGMCAHGHISRLANVMVGIHDAFLSPQSTKEQFQEAMAILSMKNIPTDEKVKAAHGLMDEMGMPQEDRVAWLEAL